MVQRYKPSRLSRISVEEINQHIIFICILLAACTWLISCGNQGCGNQRKVTANNKQKPVDNYALSLEKAKDLLEQAKDDIRADPDAAEDKLNSILQSGQNIPEAYFLLGEIFQKRHSQHQAVEHYLKYLELSTASQDKQKVILNLADAYFELGICYKRIFYAVLNLEMDYSVYSLTLVEHGSEIISDQEKADIQYFRGFYYKLLGKINAAIAAFRQVQPNTENYPMAQIQLAFCYYKTGKTQNAERILNIQSQHKEQPEIYSALLLAKTEAGKLPLDEAAKLCEKKLSELKRMQSDSTSLARVKLHLGAITMKQKKYNSALILLQEAFAILLSDEQSKKSPFFDPYAIQLIAHSYLMMAAELYSQYITFAGESEAYNAKYQLGQCYLYNGQFDDALPIMQSITEAREIDPTLIYNAEIYKGICMHRIGKKKEATKLWNELECQEVGLEIKSYLEYVYAVFEGDFQKIQQLHEQQLANVTGVFAWNLGKAYHEWGMQQPRFNDQNMAHISTAVELMEKQRRYRSRYNIERNGPFLLIDLAMAYYSTRQNFSETIELFKGISVEYPEMTPMIYTIQHINIVWLKLSTIKIIHPAWINLEFGLSYSGGERL